MKMEIPGHHLLGKHVRGYKDISENCYTDTVYLTLGRGVMGKKESRACMPLPLS